jgi:hypothetical protein
LHTDNALQLPRHQHQPGDGVPAAVPRASSTLQLPQSYGTTRCVLQARDPKWLHAWWEACQSEWEFALARVGGDKALASVVLRVYNLGPDEHADMAHAPWWYTPVNQFADRWLFEAPQAGCFYRAEVGLLGKGGLFARVAVSNTAQTPRLAPCTRHRTRVAAWSGSLRRRPSI